jgi:hypothetical protein
MKAVERGKILDTRLTSLRTSGMVQPRIASGVEIALQARNINPLTPLKIKGAVATEHHRPARGRFGMWNTVPINVANRAQSAGVPHNANVNQSNTTPYTHKALIESTTFQRRHISRDSASLSSRNVNPSAVAVENLKKHYISPVTGKQGVSTPVTVESVSGIKGKARPL